MSKPDAMDLEKIGRELEQEFSETGEDEAAGLHLSTLYQANGRGYGGIGSGRANAERLVTLLERCGFELGRLPRG